MAGSTLTRTSLTLTNDTGTASSPNGDGTVINAALWTLLLDRIDAMFSAAVTFGGVISSEGFGTHAFSAGGVGANLLSVRNTTAGTGNYGAVWVGNDASNGTTRLYALSSTFTTASEFVAGGSVLYAAGSGGLSISSSHASGTVRLYTQSTLRTTWATDGTLSHDFGFRLTGMYAQTVTGNTELSATSTTNVVCRITSASSTPVITGCLGYDGQVLIIKNVSGAAVTLAHQSTASSPALRFICPGAANVGIDDGDGVLCIYSGDDSRWLVMGI